jgi:hypothetical protein
VIGLFRKKKAANMSTKLDAFRAETDLRERILEYAILKTQYDDTIQRAKAALMATGLNSFQAIYELRKRIVKRSELQARPDDTFERATSDYVDELIALSSYIAEDMRKLDVDYEQIEQFDVGTQVGLLKGPIGRAKANALWHNLVSWLTDGDGATDSLDRLEIYLDFPTGKDTDDIFSLKNEIKTIFPHLKKLEKQHVLNALENCFRDAEKWRDRFEHEVSNDTWSKWFDFGGEEPDAADIASQVPNYPGAFRAPEVLDVFMDADPKFTISYFTTLTGLKVLPILYEWLRKCDELLKLEKDPNNDDLWVVAPRKYPPRLLLPSRAMDLEKYVYVDNILVGMVLALRERLVAIAEQAGNGQGVTFPFKKLSPRRKEIWEPVDVDRPIRSGSEPETINAGQLEAYWDDILATPTRNRAPTRKRAADPDEELAHQSDPKKPATDLKEPATALLLRFDGDVEAAAQMLARLLVV